MNIDKREFGLLRSAFVRAGMMLDKIEHPNQFSRNLKRFKFHYGSMTHGEVVACTDGDIRLDDAFFYSVLNILKHLKNADPLNYSFSYLPKDSQEFFSSFRRNRSQYLDTITSYARAEQNEWARENEPITGSRFDFEQALLRWVRKAFGPKTEYYTL